MKKEMKKTKKKRIRLHRSLNITGEFKNDKLKKNITKIKETGVSQACFKIRANGNNKLEKSLLRFCYFFLKEKKKKIKKTLLNSFLRGPAAIFLISRPAPFPQMQLASVTRFWPVTRTNTHLHNKQHRMTVDISKYIIRNLFYNALTTTFTKKI